MRDDVEAMGGKERTIFSLIQAPVIELLAAIASDSLSVLRSASEQQCSGFGEVRTQQREDLTLIVRGEMKQAVPCEKAVVLASEREAAHVRNDPSRRWKALFAQRDECARCVDSRYFEPKLNEVTRDWDTAPTTEVKNMTVRRQKRCKSFDPRALRHETASIPIPRTSVPLIETDHAFSCI